MKSGTCNKSMEFGEGASNISCMCPVCTQKVMCNNANVLPSVPCRHMITCPECTVAIATAEEGQQVTINTTDHTKLTSSKKLLTLMEQWGVALEYHSAVAIIGLCLTGANTVCISLTSKIT